MAFGSNRRKPLSTAPRQMRSAAPASKREFFSYHASRQSSDAQQTVARQPAKLPQGKTSLSWQRVPTLLVLVVLLISIIYTTTLSSSPKIIITAGKGERALRSADVYQKTAREILAQSILSKSKLTIDTGKISRQLTEAFPDLKEVEVALPLMGRRPVFKAVPERPAILLASKDGVFVVGASGKVLVKTSEVQGSESLSIPTIRDETNLTITPGKGVLSEQDVTFITTLVKQFEDKKLTITELTLPALASELRVRIGGQPYFIKFSLLTNSRIAFGQFYALKAKLETEGTVPAEYIDSRVEERVYSK